MATRQVDSFTYDVVEVLDERGNQWVVKAPRATMLGAAMEGEVALLENLRGAGATPPLPFAVPQPRGFAPLPEGGRAMVYELIPGQPLNVARLGAIAPEVAGAIAAVHALPTRIVEDSGLPTYSAAEYRAKRLAELDDAAGTGRVPAGLLNRWEAACEDVRLWQFRPTVVHGDLGPEAFLILSAKVVGVIDWASAHVGDPAVDLAPLLAGAPESAMDVLLDAYQEARGVEDPHLLARSVLASELALLRWLMHGVRTDNDDVVQDAVAMLAELDYAVAEAGPIAEVGLLPEEAPEPGPEHAIDLPAEEPAGAPEPAAAPESGESDGSGDSSDSGDSGGTSTIADSAGAPTDPVPSAASPGSGAIPLGTHEHSGVGPDDDLPTVEIRREDLDL